MFLDFKDFYYSDRKSDVVLSYNGMFVEECILAQYLESDKQGFESEYDFQENRTFDFVCFPGTKKNYFILCTNYLINAAAKKEYDSYLMKHGANIYNFHAISCRGKE